MQYSLQESYLYVKKKIWIFCRNLNYAYVMQLFFFFLFLYFKKVPKSGKILIVVRAKTAHTKLERQYQEVNLHLETRKSQKLAMARKNLQMWRRKGHPHQMMMIITIQTVMMKSKYLWGKKERVWGVYLYYSFRLFKN